MDKLERIREEIDAIDAEMLRLFERRMNCVGQIAEIKRQKRLPVLDPAREKAVLDGNGKLLADPALRDYYRAWMRHTMALSRDWQAELWTRRITDLPIQLPGKNSLLTIDRGGLDRVGWHFNTERRALLVTDDGVPQEYIDTVREQWALLKQPTGRDWMRATVVTVPQGESSKSVAVWQLLLETMQQNGFTRDDCVIALGGGMVCDLAGFAAASYLRGIDCYNIPTTLLAILDASFGGKTALNLGGVKNQIGAFHQPRRVLVDPDVLQTLPRRQLANGLAEALKIAVCFDPALFSLFETADLLEDPTPVIEPCILHKRRIVMEDAYDEGARKQLNFGHTLGHAIEAVTGLLHGEAVALGMLPMCSDPVRARLVPVLERLGLPTVLEADEAALLAAAGHDKKAHAGRIDAVLVDEIGCCRVEAMTPEALRARLGVILRQKKGRTQ